MGDKIRSIAELKKAIGDVRRDNSMIPDVIIDLINEFEASVREELKIVMGCPITDDNRFALEQNARLLRRILGGEGDGL